MEGLDGLHVVWARAFFGDVLGWAFEEPTEAAIAFLTRAKGTPGTRQGQSGGKWPSSNASPLWKGRVSIGGKTIAFDVQSLPS